MELVFDGSGFVHLSVTLYNVCIIMIKVVIFFGGGGWGPGKGICMRE